MLKTISFPSGGKETINYFYFGYYGKYKAG